MSLLALSDARSLLAAIVLLFSVFGLVWWLLGEAMQLAPQASRLLAAANIMLAAALGLDLGGANLPAWAEFWASDTLGVAGIACLRAATPVIAQLRPAWRSSLLICLPASALLAWLPQAEQAVYERSLVVFGSLSLLALLAALDALRLLRRSLRAGLSIGLALPWFALALVAGARVFSALLNPQQDIAIDAGTSFNLLWLWGALLLCLLLNTTAGFLVLMQLVLRIQRLTRHDPLTDALNRRAFSEALDDAHALMRRGQPYALLLLDLDHFKALNDQLGHAAGDAALKRVSQTLSDQLRASDLLARMGGEEFALLLPLTDAAGAQQVAERIRQRIQSQAFDWQGQAWPLSASLGVACAEPADASAEAVLERADRAMYAAKAAGRNRVRLG